MIFVSQQELNCTQAIERTDAPDASFVMNKLFFKKYLRVAGVILGLRSRLSEVFVLTDKGVMSFLKVHTADKESLLPFCCFELCMCELLEDETEVFNHAYMRVSSFLGVITSPLSRSL